MVWKLSVRRKRNDCTVPKVHIEAGGKDDHVESNATRRAMPSVRMSTATAAASTSTSGIQSTGVSTSVSPTGSPTVDSGDHPGALRAHLGRCVDTCLANMQTDPRLQSIQSTMDMMRLQMLVLGLASGSTSVQDLRKSYVDGQRLRSMGITAEHMDAAVDVLAHSMRSIGISQEDYTTAMANIAMELPMFQQAAHASHAAHDGSGHYGTESDQHETSSAHIGDGDNGVPQHDGSQSTRSASSSRGHDGNHHHIAPSPPAYPSPHEDAVVACLGSRQVLTLAVNLFFRKVMADPLVAPFFRHYTPQQLRPKLVSFLAFTLGSNPRTIESLQAVHAPLVSRGLTMRHYDAVVEHFVSTVTHLRVEQEVVASAKVNLTAMRVAFEDLIERGHTPVYDDSHYEDT